MTFLSPSYNTILLYGKVSKADLQRALENVFTVIKIKFPCVGSVHSHLASLDRSFTQSLVRIGMQFTYLKNTSLGCGCLVISLKFLPNFVQISAFSWNFQSTNFASPNLLPLELLKMCFHGAVFVQKQYPNFRNSLEKNFPIRPSGDHRRPGDNIWERVLHLFVGWHSIPLTNVFVCKPFRF